MNIELIKNVDKNMFLQLNLEQRRKIGEISNMKIYVYDNEGQNIPHFHIRINDLPDACLKILEAKWFDHGKNTGVLYRKQLKELYNWLCENNYKYWKEIIIEWNKHANNKIDINLKIPNYLNII